MGIGERSARHEPSITILHVSDMQFGRHHRFGRLGLGGGDEAFDTLLRRLTEDLDLLRKEEGLEPDLVALTGDLAEWARPKEYADMLQFCEGLRAYLKLGPDRVLVIPGNHDINRALCESYFKEREGLDEHPKEPYWPKWKPYVDFFGKLYKDVERYEFKETEPYTWFELPELKMVVAGLNSTMRESHKERDPTDPESIFGHYGYVGEAQLAWFRKRLEEAEAKRWLRVGLVHHNALRGAMDDDENLRDARLLEDRIGPQFNLLLHGHTHQGSIGWLGRDLPVISTGSAAVKFAQRPEEVPNQYQILQVYQEGICRWARQYRPGARKWVGDTSVSPTGSDWRHVQPVAFPHTGSTFGARESGTRANSSASKPSADDADDDHQWGAREPDDLLAQVMASCRVRDESGRVQPARVRSQGQWGDHGRVSDPARGTYLLGAHPGPITLDLLDRWVKDVHEPFRSKGHDGRSSDLVVASAEPIGEEVKARAGACGVHLWRLLDYENVIDTERWKERQNARLDGNREYRRDLYIEQRVTLWSPVDDARESVLRAADRIAETLSGRDGCFVLVLGPAGTGKTFLLREVARRMAEQQQLVTPIVVELRGLDRARDVYELVNWEFARGKQTLPPRAFERDLREGRIALLFDGFDELAIRVSSAAIPEHFTRILSAARDRAKVMVTSRAEHFLSHQAAVETLMSRGAATVGLAGQLQTITQRRLVATQKFTHDDITEYLGRALGSPEAGRARMERFRKVHDLPGLAATPRMLSFLVRLTDEQLDAAARRDAITSAELYRLVILDQWLAQQEERLNPPGSASGPTRSALLDAATGLARYLWRSTAKSVDAADLEAHAGDHLRNLCDDDGDTAGQMLQSRTLLTHGEDGRFEFVHQTVLEWLVAQSIAAELKSDGGSADLEQGRLDDFMIDVLRELLGDVALAAWAERALECTPGNRLAENARLALAQMGREVTIRRADLRGQDLRGQSLEGQNLRGALLDGANLGGVDLSARDLRGASLRGATLAYASLRGADLADANLEDADLSFARLDRANLDRVRWSGASLLATSALGAKGMSDPAQGRFKESGAWEIDDRTAWCVPQAAVCLAVSFSPNGRLLVSAHADGSARLWDAAGAVLLRVLEGHAGGVLSVAWSPDGARLATGSDDRTMRLWDAATGRTLRTFEGHANSVQSVAWSPDGARLATGSDDRTVRLWDAATGRTLRTFEGHANGVQSVAWSPDGARLATGSYDQTVRLWDAGTGEALRTCVGHASSVQSVAWSPDGTRLATGSGDRAVRLWEARTGRALRTFEGHANSVQSVAWSPDGTRLATGSSDRAVRLWEAETGRTLLICEGHTSSVLSVAWSPDGTRLASGSSDCTVRLWEAGTGEALRTFKGHLNSVQSVAWRPDGARFAIGSGDRTVRLWEVGTGRVLPTCVGHTHPIRVVAWSPDGAYLATWSDDERVRLWEAETGRALLTCMGHTPQVRSVAWSPDGTRLASGSGDHTMQLWEAETGRALLSGVGHTSSIRSVVWSPDGTRLATGSDDRTVRLWDAATGRALRIFEGHTSGVQSVAWSPGGTRLASGSDDRAVRLWEAGTGRTLLTFEGHTSSVLSVAWSPDGTRLASGSSDCTVRLWEAGTGKVLGMLRGHLGSVTWVSWSLDGRFISSAGIDGSLRLWDAATERCLAVYVATPYGNVAIRPSDGRYRVQGDPGGRVAFTIGLVRYELSELDEFVEGGLRLPDAEPLVLP